jgi:ubiquinone/menaquinone biosynthesis C-methylase UbiE
MDGHRYTFGDNEQASLRLRRLAEIYEQETRELLQRGDIRGPRLAVDLGCGPGWSTQVIRDVLSPDRTVGLDASDRYIAEARKQHSGLEFEVHDIARAPFPLRTPDVLFCRFVLTHVRAVGKVLRTWAGVAAPRALLFVHETESMETENPSLRRYYEMVAQLQKHYGQTLEVGSILEESFENSGWRLRENRRLLLEKPANQMAGLHLANLRTWRHDAYASQAFDPNEVDGLEASLEQIALGKGGVVVNAARQIIAQRI